MDSPDISPLDSGAMDDLPSVPRIRKNAPAASSSLVPPSTPSVIDSSILLPPRSTDNRAISKPKALDRRRHVGRKKWTDSRSASPPPMPRMNYRRSRTLKVLDDDDDDDDDDAGALPVPASPKSSKNKSKLPSSKPSSRFQSKSVSRSRSQSQSHSPSEISPAPSRFASRSDSLSFDDENNSRATPMEGDHSPSIGYDSDDSPNEAPSKSDSASVGTRLTKRQRALKGEKIELEYSKLDSPKSKKKSSAKEDWTPGDEKDLQRQQRARMRQLVTEKRNKEKRAATVDKVLRGVTSKRKKMSLANEALSNRRDSRMLNTGVPKGFVRYTSGHSGSIIAVHPDDALPEALNVGKVVSHYPRPCVRDPKTGKRIFAE